MELLESLSSGDLTAYRLNIKRVIRNSFETVRYPDNADSSMGSHSDPFSVKLDTRLLSQEKPSCLHHVIFIGPKPGMD